MSAFLAMLTSLKVSPDTSAQNWSASPNIFLCWSCDLVEEKESLIKNDSDNHNDKDSRNGSRNENEKEMENGNENRSKKENEQWAWEWERPTLITKTTNENKNKKHEKKKNRKNTSSPRTTGTSFGLDLRPTEVKKNKIK